ncbi:MULTISPECIES: hypothetical protein [Ochrobactrum]|uniref:hypothetical protein n=1 Tax=Ochrobactrum TaxID=528 RepID=UPI000B1E036C|nr:MULTISPECIES: hypothetical protein [Brucella/Ochrobactrum group]MBD7990277.1 hypothetical protein [Ochrobactrum gallinarum]MCV9908779.1 hypothetical protein [Brucella sp. HL-2]
MEILDQKLEAQQPRHIPKQGDGHGLALPPKLRVQNKYRKAQFRRRVEIASSKINTIVGAA